MQLKEMLRASGFSLKVVSSRFRAAMKKQLVIEYEELTHYSELSGTERELVERAIAASEKAYAPYSKFKVGAALLLSDKSIVTGNNQENKAYPSGLCAERVALFHAGSNFPEKEIETLAIFAKGDLLPEDLSVTPCGGCRQVMCESEERQQRSIRIILVAQNGKVTLFNRAADLLIFSFGNPEA